MSGNPFTYPAWDLTTGTPLDPLPYVGVTFGRQINKPGPWAGVFPVTDERARKFAWESSSRTGRTLLCVDLRGTLVWGGIIWTRKYRKTEKRLIVGAMDLGSYFQQRLQAAGYDMLFLAGENPLLIVKKIMEDALAVSNFGAGLALRIVVNEASAVPKVSAQYPATSLQQVDGIINTLSQMGYGAGFDYSFDVAYRNGTMEPELTMNLWYPRQGRLVSDTGITLFDGDCLDWEYPEDSTQQATEVVETGSGSGGIVPASASVTIPGYPLLQRTSSHSQVLSEETLAEVALGELGIYCYPVVTPWIELPILPGPLELGEFALGDDLLWRVDPVAGSENTNPRFPNGMSFEWRISDWTVTPADSGLSKLHLGLSIPPLSTVPPPRPPL